MTQTRSLLASKYPGKIGAWVAEMAYGIADPIHEAVLREASSGTLGYNDPLSLDAARESVVRWMSGSYAWSIRPESIGFVGDIVSGLAATMRHFLPAGTPVVVPTPAYGPLLTVPELFGHPVIRVPGRSAPAGYEMDLEGIDEALTGGGRMVILCHPHNPTGRSFSREELASLADVVDAHQARVFSDEVHAPLSLTGRQHIPYAAVDHRTAGHTITATSASKGWNTAGLKCAQLIFSSPLDARCWEGVGHFYLRSVSRLGVAALRAAYGEADSHAWLAATLKRLKANNAAVTNAVARSMPHIGYVPAESTYLAWLDCSGLRHADPARYFRERAGVVLTEGAEFGSPSHVRLNFALSEKVLAEALAALAEAAAAADMRNVARAGIGTASDKQLGVRL